MVEEELATRAVRIALAFAEALRQGDLCAVQHLTTELDDVRREAQETPELLATLDLLAESVAVVTAQHRREDRAAALASFRRLADRLPAGHPLRTQAVESAAQAELMLSAAAGTPPTLEQIAALVAEADRPGLPPAEQAQCHAVAGGLAFGEGASLLVVRAGVDQFRAAIRLAPVSDSRRITYLIGLATGLFRQIDLTGRLADLDEAGLALTEARTLSGGPNHPQWSMINDMLSHVIRRRPGSPAGRSTGETAGGDIALEGLRAHAWQALRLSDPVAIRDGVRDAAREAVDLARRFVVDDGDPARAIRALDAGRALALFAAQQSRSVDERPDRAGTADPLDAPALDDIAYALSLVEADALVYLIAGDGYRPGHAVIAAAAGPPAYLTLPELRVEAGLDIERYLAALTRRDRTLRPAGAAEAEFVRSLDELCDWAWRAAMGPLIERYLTGPAPRIVLVPVGELAWVPWAAARRGDGTYAIQLISISQAASARMLCWSAGRRPVPTAPIGLVVGDPDTAGRAGGLRGARREACAVHRSFYRGARYLGRRADGSPSPSGAGTADEVRAWLADTAPEAGTTAHFACHGVLEAGDSYLVLAGGSQLAAGAVIETLRGAPTRDLGLVVLAACRTGRVITGYDEAFSLGSAFLAAGARSVLATQWNVPDRATSVLMFLFHDFLAQGRPVWQALREAQLWMLRPDREPLDSMPRALRDRLGDAAIDPAAVVEWAAFVHGGQ